MHIACYKAPSAALPPISGVWKLVEDEPTKNQLLFAENCHFGDGLFRFNGFASNRFGTRQKLG